MSTIQFFRSASVASILVCGAAAAAGNPSQPGSAPPVSSAGSSGGSQTIGNAPPAGAPPQVPLAVPFGSCSRAPISAGVIASVQTQLAVQASAQAAALIAAQNFIPVMNARAQATINRINYLLTADPIDPAQAAALTALQTSADTAYQAALPAWTMAFTMWRDSYDALKGVLDANTLRAGEFGCYGISAPQPTPRVYRCGNVYTGSASVVDSSGSLFRQLQQYAGTNYYFCAQQR